MGHDNLPHPPELRISRVFAAPRALVFQAWGSSRHVRSWFCPAMFTIPEANVELRVGGAFEVCMRAPDGTDHWTRGNFTEITPDERLVIDMRIAGDDGTLLFTARTEVAFADAAGGTRMDVVQSYVIHHEAALNMVGGAPVGWAQTLDRLAAALPQFAADVAPRSVAHGSFELRRVLDAPPACVWRALTELAAKAAWFVGPPGKWQLLERRMDVRAGGSERVRGQIAGGVTTCFDAVYLDVVAPHRLVYAYEMHLDERKISVSLATMQLHDEGGRTALTLTEQGAFLDGYDDAGSREAGSAMLLDALAAAVRA